jgi:Avirulence protein
VARSVRCDVVASDDSLNRKGSIMSVSKVSNPGDYSNNEWNDPAAGDPKGAAEPKGKADPKAQPEPAPSAADQDQKAAAQSNIDQTRQFIDQTSAEYNKAAEGKAPVQKWMDSIRKNINEGYGDDQFKNIGKTQQALSDLDSQLKSGAISATDAETQRQGIVDKFTQEYKRVSGAQANNARVGETLHGIGRTSAVISGGVAGSGAGPLGTAGGSIAAGSAYDAASQAFFKGANGNTFARDLNTDSLGGLAVKKLQGQEISNGDVLKAGLTTLGDGLNGVAAARALTAPAAGASGSFLSNAGQAIKQNGGMFAGQAVANNMIDNAKIAVDDKRDWKPGEKEQKITQNLARLPLDLAVNVGAAGLGGGLNLKQPVQNELAQLGVDASANGLQKATQNAFDGKGFQLDGLDIASSLGNAAAGRYTPQLAGARPNADTPAAKSPDSMQGTGVTPNSSVDLSSGSAPRSAQDSTSAPKSLVDEVLRYFHQGSGGEQTLIQGKDGSYAFASINDQPSSGSRSLPPEVPQAQKEQTGQITGWPNLDPRVEPSPQQKQQYSSSMYDESRAMAQRILDAQQTPGAAVPTIGDVWAVARNWRTEQAGAMGMKGQALEMMGQQRVAEEGATQLTDRYSYMGPRVQSLFGSEPVPLGHIHPNVQAAHRDTPVIHGQIIGTTNAGRDIALSTLTFPAPPLSRTDLNQVATETSGKAARIVPADTAQFPAIHAQVSKLFDEAIDPARNTANDQSFVDSAAKLYWWLSHAMPDSRGSSAKADFVLQTVFQAQGIDLPSTKPGVVPNLEAIFSHEADFVQQFPQMFNGPLRQ